MQTKTIAHLAPKRIKAIYSELYNGERGIPKNLKHHHSGREGCMHRHSHNNRSVGQVTDVCVSAHIITAYAHGLEEYY